MELVQEVAMAEQRAELNRKDLSDLDLLSISTSIQKACMERMFKYENGENAEYVQNKDQKKATYVALGARVVTYKKKKSIAKLGDTPGTPPDNKSNRDLLGRATK